MPEPLYVNFASIVDVDDRTISGLAVPFDQDSHPHHFGGATVRHRFRRGAFTRSIAERGSKIKLMAAHDIKSFPIGRATSLHEADDGVRAEFELFATPRGDEALTLVRDGVITGLSVGVDPLKWTEAGGVVEHTETRLREISLVDEPAFEAAGIAASADETAAPELLSTRTARLRLRLVERASRW